MEKIDEKQIASYVMDALNGGPYSEMFADFGLQPVRQEGSYAIEFRPIHPISGEPREGETFTMVVNKTGVQSRTIKITGFPNSGRGVGLVKHVSSATGLNLKSAHALIYSPLPTHIECVSQVEAEHLRGWLREVGVVCE